MWTEVAADPAALLPRKVGSEVELVSRGREPLTTHPPGGAESYRLQAALGRGGWGGRECSPPKRQITGTATDFREEGRRTLGTSRWPDHH